MQDLIPQLVNFAFMALAFLTFPLLALAQMWWEGGRRSVHDRQHAIANYIKQHDRIMAEVRDNEAKRQASFDATMADMMKTHAEVEALRVQTRAKLDHVLRLQAEYERMMIEIDPQREADLQTIHDMVNDAPTPHPPDPPRPR